MSKNPLPIILNKKTTDRKLFKEYKKTVEGLLPKPKQKD
jgi:steroid 5-alpha reductase family enzyme